jgi:hypothetical protein
MGQDKNNSSTKFGEATGGKSDERTGKTDNSSKSKSRRARPFKSQRASVDKATESSRTKDQQHPGPEPTPQAPQPGKYPVLFQAEVGKPVHEQGFSTAWDTNIRNHYNILRCMAYLPEWDRYRAELAQGLTPADIRQFEGEFVATGVLTTAQNIVRTAKLNGRDIQGESSLDKTDIVHTMTNRTVSSQYGVTKSPETGEILAPVNIKQGSRKAVRASKYIWQNTQTAAADVTTEQICEAAASRAWLPSSPQDADFETSIRKYLQDWLNRRNYEFILATRNLPILTNTNPPWRNVIHNDHWPEIKWIFAGRPNNIQQWVQHINNIPEQFYEHTSCPRPIGFNGQPANVNQGDLNFALDERSELGLIADSWAKRAPILQTYFHTAGTADCTAEGTRAQTATHLYEHEAVSYSNYTTNTRTEASLAACFPPSINMPYARRTREATGVCQSNRQEAAMQWVMKAIK